MAAYYGEDLETQRLATEARLERVRTEGLLDRVLPAPPAVVLDVGGGPGVHATWLQRRRHSVRLLDPIALHVEQVRAAGVADAATGDARALPWEDGEADAVLLLGPLYHLPERPRRVLALAEARRVARPGASWPSPSSRASPGHWTGSSTTTSPTRASRPARSAAGASGGTRTRTACRPGSRRRTSTVPRRSRARSATPASRWSPCSRSRARPSSCRRTSTPGS